MVGVSARWRAEHPRRGTFQRNEEIVSDRDVTRREGEVVACVLIHQKTEGGGSLLRDLVVPRGMNDRIVLEDHILEIRIDWLEQVQPHRIDCHIVGDGAVANDPVVLLNGIGSREVPGATFEQTHAPFTVVVVKMDVLDHGACLTVHDLEATSLGTSEGLVRPPAVNGHVVRDLVVRPHHHEGLRTPRGVHVPRITGHSGEIMNHVARDQVVRPEDAEAELENPTRAVDFAVSDGVLTARDHDPLGYPRALDGLDPKAVQHRTSAQCDAAAEAAPTSQNHDGGRSSRPVGVEGIAVGEAEALPLKDATPLEMDGGRGTREPASERRQISPSRLGAETVGLVVPRAGDVVLLAALRAEPSRENHHRE